jgi:hypothetical protein
MLDRAAIFSSILTRNALRREAHLPLLDVRGSFKREVRQALWREHVEQHHETVRAQVLRDFRERLGSDMLSAGGRWAINAMTHKTLVESFRARRST